MAIQKYHRAPHSWDKDKLLSELTAAFGQAPTISLSVGGDLEVTVPAGIPSTLCDRVVNSHSAETIYQPINAVFGGDAGKLDGGGVQVSADAQSVDKVALAGRQFAINKALQIGGGTSLGTLGILPIYQTLDDSGGNVIARFGAMGGFAGAAGKLGGMWFNIEQYDLDENNVLNGDFEMGDLTGWTPTVVGTGQVTVDTENAIADTYCLKVDNGDTTATAVSDRITTPLTGVLSFLAATTGGQSALHVKWYDATSGGSLLQTDSQQIQVGSEGVSWAYYTMILKPPTGALSFEIVIPTLAADRVTYLDNVRVTSNTSPPGMQGLFFHVNGQGPYYYGLGNFNRVSYGDYAGHALAPDDTNENTIYSRTFKGGSIGANGTIRGFAVIKTTNNGDAANYTCVPRIKWGGSTVFTGDTLSLSASANRHAYGIYEFQIANQNSVSAQHCTARMGVILNQTAISAAGGNPITDKIYGAPTSINTALDAALAISVQKSSADADFDVELLGVWLDGPHYSA